MRKILAIEKNSWKNLWKVRNILSIACNVSLDKMPKEVKKERRVLTREEQEKFFTFASSYIHINVLKFACDNRLSDWRSAWAEMGRL